MFVPDVTDVLECIELDFEIATKERRRAGTNVGSTECTA